MNLRLEQSLTGEDIEVLIRYAKMNPTVKRLANLIRAADNAVRCRTEDGEVWVNATDIYYAESVDKRTFVYTEKAVYKTELRLYHLMEQLSPAGFVQISKACILNLAMLSGIRALLNSRMEATLTNGEKLMVTRKYIPAIKAKLQER